MNKKRFLELLEIVRRYLGDEPSHGVPHILRVHSNFLLFKSENPPVSERVLNAVELACLFHDLGRSQTTIEKWRGHPDISEEILKKIFPKELSDFLPYQDLVLYAVDLHEDWINYSPKNEKDICLGLLVLFDIMDAIGEYALFRGGIDWGSKIPWLPKRKEWPKEKIKNYLEQPNLIIKESRDAIMKDSFLIHLLYNYCAMISIILPPVKKYLGPAILKEIQRRLEVLKIFILELTKSIDYPSLSEG